MKRQRVLIRNEGTVKYKDKLGMVIIGEHETDKLDKPLFLPANYGSYRERDLEIINPKELFDTTIEEKIEYLKLEFDEDILGVSQLNSGEYVIIKYVSSTPIDGEKIILYHTYLNFKNIHRSYYTLDQALIGLLDYKYRGANSQSGGFLSAC